MSDAEPQSQTRTILIIGLAVVAIAALVAFVLLPLLGGDDDGAEDPGVTIDPSEPVATPSEDFELADPDEVDEEEPPGETFEVFNARDPFQQLVREEAGGGGGGGDTPAPGASPAPTGGGTVFPPASPGPVASPTPGTTNGTGDGTGNGDGTGDGDGDGTGDGTGDGNGDGESADVGGTNVTLVDVFTDDDDERKATVTVNGTGYTVGEGDTFARRFRLLDISGRCSTMLFGDSRFTLCEGERIRK